MRRASLALALLWLVLLPALASADAMDDAVRRVGLQLQCPVCEGQNVADSGSGLAQDMRALIRTRLAAGLTESQILDEFVVSYGDGILTEPPKRGIGLGVWLGPIVALVAGGIILAVLLVQWRGRAAPMGAPAAPDPAVADEMRRYREEYGQ